MANVEQSANTKAEPYTVTCLELVELWFNGSEDSISPHATHVLERCNALGMNIQIGGLGADEEPCLVFNSKQDFLLFKLMW